MKKLQLTIYLDESDRSGDLPLHEVIVRRLLALDIAGATVTRGVMGYGHHHKVHRQRLFGVSDDRPIIITTVDDESRLRPVVAELRAMVPEGLFTLQDVETL